MWEERKKTFLQMLSLDLSSFSLSLIYMTIIIGCVRIAIGTDCMYIGKTQPSTSAVRYDKELERKKDIEILRQTNLDLLLTGNKNMDMLLTGSKTIQTESLLKDSNMNKPVGKAQNT